LDFEGVLGVAEREERSGVFICGLAVDLWRTYKMVSTMYYETKKWGYSQWNGEDQEIRPRTAIVILLSVFDSTPYPVSLRVRTTDK